MGNMSEWTKCQEKTDLPARKEFNLPKVSFLRALHKIFQGVITTSGHFPQSYREEYDFCKLYKFKAGQVRILQHNPSTIKSSQEGLASNGSANGSGYERNRERLTCLVGFFPSSLLVVLSRSQKSGSQISQPLKNLTFVLEGKNIDREALRSGIERLGGKVGKKVTESTAAVVADKGRKKNTRETFITHPLFLYVLPLQNVGFFTHDLYI